MSNTQFPSLKNAEDASAAAAEKRCWSWIFLSLSATAFAGGFAARSIVWKEIGGVLLMGAVGYRMGAWIDEKRARTLSLQL